eukprot:CAMPEP_0176367032 /NCGR_PEP_ID=MMETSP0126-20121128/21593_1 /TAXON_ID=141414 ORGANISM="Strombidinopsis acuminatum, Strain SPMC142" /NCGR_SAMPLE_ID=MMETSP0126 /ASSEMBLY_ACC=CAM_ASM_000229 /LENGTH=85 /DNA_ID=CAMNT_0017724685 /DNA_START=1252 /DNA_END=1509 /DNA_ORIENTATION=-
MSMLHQKIFLILDWIRNLEARVFDEELAQEDENNDAEYTQVERKDLDLSPLDIDDSILIIAAISSSGEEINILSKKHYTDVDEES